jgi:hypothetical protein
LIGAAFGLFVPGKYKILSLSDKNAIINSPLTETWFASTGPVCVRAAWLGGKRAYRRNSEIAWRSNT